MAQASITRYLGPDADALLRPGIELDGAAHRAARGRRAIREPGRSPSPGWSSAARSSWRSIRRARCRTLLIDGRPLTEVAGILFYLAKRFPEAGLLPHGDIEAEAQAISWMSFIAATVHPARRHRRRAGAEMYPDRRSATGAAGLGARDVTRSWTSISSGCSGASRGPSRSARDVSGSRRASRPHDGASRRATDVRDRGGDRVRAAGIALAQRGGMIGSSRCESKPPPVWMVTVPPAIRSRGSSCWKVLRGSSCAPTSSTSRCPRSKTTLVGQISISTATGSPGATFWISSCVWYGRYGVERSGSSLRCDARSQPYAAAIRRPLAAAAPGRSPRCRRGARCARSRTDRRRRSLDETQSLSLIGPVTSISCSSGAVANATRRARRRARRRSSTEAVAGRRGRSRGARPRRRDGSSVHCVRASGHSFS